MPNNQSPGRAGGGQSMPAPSPTTSFASAPALDIDLKDPRLAAFLAWLVPGLGHLYQGRRGKGVLFFVCIVGTFVYGLYVGGGRGVDVSGPRPLTPSGG